MAKQTYLYAKEPYINAKGDLLILKRALPPPSPPLFLLLRPAPAPFPLSLFPNTSTTPYLRDV